MISNINNINNINYINFHYNESTRELQRVLKGNVQGIELRDIHLSNADNQYDISVIITNYNRENTIDKAIISVLENSDESNLEIVIVDDGSNDNSINIISKYLKLDNISLIALKKNTGNEALPKNIGGYFSKGRYLSYLDSDDEIYNKRAYNESLKIMDNNPNFVMSHTNIIFQIECKPSLLQSGPSWMLSLDDYKPKNEEDIDSGFIYKIRKTRSYSTYEMMTYGYYDGMKLIRKELWEKIGGTVEWLESCCDFGLYVKLNRYGNVANVDIDAYKYIIDGNNDSFYSPNKSNRYYEKHRTFVRNELSYRKISYEQVIKEANEEFLNRYKFNLCDLK
ncbi:glycosyltransferase family 2 protein [Bacillus pseudomycoides]|uniref:glycosyltransferase family 2 protein n=1 Tax=Bacillus pseudomycoides TaxID=64104 RepID=UPI000BF7008B|nr:glycosyltransferase family 2 protein [Bacillus pseudomycoides]PGD73700.1 hypothetical protein COM46_21720 [Bacillus pseudomycoides]